MLLCYKLFLVRSRGVAGLTRVPVKDKIAGSNPVATAYFGNFCPERRKQAMWKSIKDRFSSPDSYVSMALGLAVVLLIGMVSLNYIRRQTVPGEGAPGETSATESAAMALPTTHTVKTGESLWSIALSYYKSGYNWVDIAKANRLANANHIEIGQKLNIPSATPIVPPGSISSASTEKLIPKHATYAVNAGDTLWAIAVTEYNNGYQWTAIAKANNLVNPDLIHAGNVLRLP